MTIKPKSEHHDHDSDRHGDSDGKVVSF